MVETYSVYKHRHKDSGKCYIGITSKTPPSLRWGEYGRNYRTQPVFFKAILRYGWDNFDHDILFEGLTKQEAFEKEVELIAKYKSNEDEFGFNVYDGGNDSVWTKNSQPVFQYDADGNFIARYKSCNEAAKELSIAVANISSCCHKENNQVSAKGFLFIYEKDVTDKEIQNMIDRYNHKFNYSRNVDQYDLEGNFIKSFNSAKIASEEIGVSVGSISDCCRGDCMTCKGYIFIYHQKYMNRRILTRLCKIRDSKDKSKNKTKKCSVKSKLHKTI